MAKSIAGYMVDHARSYYKNTGWIYYNPKEYHDESLTMTRYVIL